MKIGVVILAGGKSCRMGTDKAVLTYEGQSFLERITKELGCFDEIILSSGDDKTYRGTNLTTVKDIFPNCGPIGGIYAALLACKSDALFCIPCDVPLFKRYLAEYMCSKTAEDSDATVSISKDGRLLPLCAVYKKTTANIFEKQILLNNYKITDAYKLMNVRYVSLDEINHADTYLFNVNTPEEYRGLKFKSWINNDQPPRNKL